jgi:hypothetical protein
MSHPSLIFENWNKINFNNNKKANLTFNKYPVQYIGLDIPSAKLYFYLKENHGMPNVIYSSIKKFFPDRLLSTGNEWCYVFQESTNYILICGDDKINITVLSISEPPEKLDFDLFSIRINEKLKSYSLDGYKNIGYDIYINYSFYLNNLISEYKNVIKKKLPTPPNQLSLSHEDMNSKDEEVRYKYVENNKDYNLWLKLLLEKAMFSLNIQILLPIYFESLVDMAFRMKLKKSLFNKSKIYGDKEIKLDIFEYFEVLPTHVKIKEIKNKCFDVNTQRINRFISDMWDDKESGNKKKKERNKLLHGNALFFQNLNLKFYVDEKYLIGFPDRARGIRTIVDSIQSSMDEKKLIETLNIYEKRCNDFINVFDDNGYFKSLIAGIAFAHNPETGGCVSIGINKYQDLFAPTEW